MLNQSAYSASGAHSSSGGGHGKIMVLCCEIMVPVAWRSTTSREAG